MSIDAIQGGTRSDINEVLSKIRKVSSQSKIFEEHGSTTATSNFSDVLSIAKNAVSQVSESQTTADQVKNAYISGDSHITMSQVIMASQKSKLAFEGLITVRNKILEAYKEIMAMPI